MYIQLIRILCYINGGRLGLHAFSTLLHYFCNIKALGVYLIILYSDCIKLQ